MNRSTDPDLFPPSGTLRFLRACPLYNPSKTLSDSVHAEGISLGQRELELINTSEFQRLGYIQQLGYLGNVHRAATHTRFIHSLGTYQISWRILNSLWWKGDLEGINWQSASMIPIAGLLHDIGHYPFSHTIEELGHPILSHEKRGRSIIEKSNIATILERYQINPARVADIIDPPPEGSAYYHPHDKLLSAIISGGPLKFPVDADRLDYLIRDVLACGMKPIDLYHTIEALRIKKMHGRKRFVVEIGGVTHIQRFLEARRDAYLNLYTRDKEERSLKIMLIRAVQEALLHDALLGSSLLLSTDTALILHLRSSLVPATRALAEALYYRRVYNHLPDNPPLIISPRSESFKPLDIFYGDAAARRALEIKVGQLLVEEGEEYAQDGDLPPVLISIPRPISRMRLDNIWTWDPQPALGHKEFMPFEEVTAFAGDQIYNQDQAGRMVMVFTAGKVPERPLLRALQEALAIISPQR